MRPSSALSEPSSRSVALGYFIGALGAAFFATKGIVIKLAIPLGVDATTALTWRMIIAVPFFIVIGWLGYRERKRTTPAFDPSRRDILATCLVGSVGYYLASYLDFAGLQYISAQFDRLILLTYPFFVVIIGAVFFGNRITPLMIGALLISYFGLGLIFAHDLKVEGEDTIIGALLVLGAAIAYASYQVFAKPLIDRMGSRFFTSVALSASGVVVILQFLLTHPLSDLILQREALWLMLMLGTVSTVLPAYLIAASIGMVGPQPTAIMGNVAPLVTIVLAVYVLGETFSPWHAAGSAMVLFGIFAFARAEGRIFVREQPYEQKRRF